MRRQNPTFNKNKGKFNKIKGIDLAIPILLQEAVHLMSTTLYYTEDTSNSKFRIVNWKNISKGTNDGPNTVGIHSS